jgi:hypothetical protein
MTTDRRSTTTATLTLASAVLTMLFLIACSQSQPPAPAVAPESKAPATTDVYIVFEGPWAFAPDPKDANSVLALAPKTKSHRDLIVQSADKKLAPGVYQLSLPPHSGSASGTVDPNILRVKIDPQSVQHVLDTKAERYALRLPKPEAYVAATRYRSRAGSTYPPDVSTEKDYVTSVSLRYSVASLNGFSLAGSPDTGSFNPLLLQVDTPVINFVIDPVAAPSPSDKCHTHEREAFRDLTRLVNVTYFLDFPNDATDCHGKDPQNPRPVKAEVVPNLPGFFVRAFAVGSNKHLLAALYFFGGHAVDCMAAVIVASD